MKKQRPQPKPWVHRVTLFTAEGCGFAPESNAGKFLDALIQLCTEPPEYLHPQDAIRYLYLLPLLKAFSGSDWHNPGADNRSMRRLPLWIPHSKAE